MPKKLSLPWPGSDWYEFVRYSVGTDQLFGELPHVMHVILDGENGLSNLFWSSLHLLKISIKFPELRTLEIHYVDCERDFEFPEKVDKIECITKLILREALCSSFQAMDLVQCFSKLEDVTTFDQCDRKDSNSDRVWLWDYHAIRKLLMCYLQCLKRLTIHSQNIDEYHSISLIEVSDFRALEYLSLSAQDLGTGSDYFPVATACDLMFKAKKLKTFVLYYGGLEDDEDDESPFFDDQDRKWLIEVARIVHHRNYALKEVEIRNGTLMLEDTLKQVQPVKCPDCSKTLDKDDLLRAIEETRDKMLGMGVRLKVD